MVANTDLRERMYHGSPSFHGNSKGLKLEPRELLRAKDNKIDFERLESLAGQSVCRAAQFDRAMVIEICRFAALLELTEIANYQPLAGKIAITAFFEASTRTRLSFESAVLRLDGKVLSVPDGRFTGAAKGESLADIGEMFNTYGDVVIMRHFETQAIEEIQKNLRLPLINAGNGSGEHPTQALSDWYTLLKWKPSLTVESCSPEDRLHLGIVGTPGSMRAVKSFLFLAFQFSESIREITIVSDMADPLGAELYQAIATSEIKLNITHDIQSGVGDFDIIYMNSIALLGDSYRLLDNRYKLCVDSPLKQGAVIMHPLARRDELSSCLDDTPHNLYFAQAASAVFLRQALLICLLDRLGDLPTSVLYLASE